jgi:hypothetical protein
VLTITRSRCGLEAVGERRAPSTRSEGDLADEGMANGLDAGALEPHVVRSPERPERVALRRQLPHEVGELGVGRIAAGPRVQHGDHVLGDALPVEVEALRAWVEERKPRAVDGLVGLSKCCE